MSALDYIGNGFYLVKRQDATTKDITADIAATKRRMQPELDRLQELEVMLDRLEQIRIRFP